MSKPEFYTPPAAAKILRASKNTVHRLIKSGELRASNLGQKTLPRWRISQADLKAYLDSKSNSAVEMQTPWRGTMAFHAIGRNKRKFGFTEMTRKLSYAKKTPPPVSPPRLDSTRHENALIQCLILKPFLIGQVDQLDATDFVELGPKQAFDILTWDYRQSGEISVRNLRDKLTRQLGTEVFPLTLSGNG